MKIFYTIFVSTLLLSLSSCGGKESQTKGSEKTVYSCPMHHEVRKDSKGQCPVCGMDLVVVPDINEW